MELVAFGAQFSEPVEDPGPHLRGGAGVVVGELFVDGDLGFLGGLVLPDPQLQGSTGRVTVGLGVGVGGGELRGDQGGSAGSEEVGTGELADDAVQDFSEA